MRRLPPVTFMWPRIGRRCAVIRGNYWCRSRAIRRSVRWMTGCGVTSAPRKQPSDRSRSTANPVPTADTGSALTLRPRIPTWPSVPSASGRTTKGSEQPLTCAFGASRVPRFDVATRGVGRQAASSLVAEPATVQGGCSCDQGSSSDAAGSGATLGPRRPTNSLAQTAGDLYASPLVVEVQLVCAASCRTMRWGGSPAI